ncbi:hypothetical protein GCM10023264_14340 [Sphingomonas daechungensis]|uniref:Uncharacterized protein n=1 Tax=Sphingomonas daechungensis TaxID=1176646 RepID=A0ABX6T4X6_9SPHN|nr:hypothetical protein [Sphingomonas daechungensis]QNP44263.1 hypothetical protein H9L15_07350 [Sphingomonas daechungensis]
MRAVLLLLILAVVALIVLVATGLIDINQTRPAEVPQVSVNSNGITATGGQTPAFDVETGTVSVGANQANVTVPVPSLKVNPADGNQAQPATNTAQ